MKRAQRSWTCATLLAAWLLLGCEETSVAATDAEAPHDHQHDGSDPDVVPLQPMDAAMWQRDATTPRADADLDDDAGGDARVAPAFEWPLPPWLPEPVVPENNPMSDVKVELGRHLFYDTRLSENDTQSCASCHQQDLAFADGERVAVGSTGELHPRNSMALANVAYAASLTWANPLLLTLETQAITPIFGDRPVELGLRGMEDELLRRLRDDERYAVLFPLAFPEDEESITISNMTRALSAFERVLISSDSPYDRYVYGGDESALSEAAQRGGDLFNSERLECFHCHNGFNFQDSINYVGKGPLELRFHNTGLYNIGGTGAYPEPNTGVQQVTRKASDMGRFRVPSLRNIARTAPYMHDGSIATLDEVLDHYAAGGRTIESGPNAGNGSQSPFKSDLVVGFEISAQERADVIAFLESLTDETFMTNPALSDPWEQACAACESQRQ